MQMLKEWRYVLTTIGICNDTGDSVLDKSCSLLMLVLETPKNSELE